VVSSFDVAKNGRPIDTFGPRMNYYPTQREPIVTPAVHEKLNGDLYFSLIEIGRGDGATVIVRLIHQPYQIWLWFSAPVIALGSIITLWPQRERERRSTATLPETVAAGRAS
jgi:cytochrome c-type biogenesis protein CcmF